MQTKKRTKNAKITALSEGWLSGYDVGLWPTDFSLPVPIPWLTGNHFEHFVGKLSAVGQPTRLTQPSIHPVREMSSNPCNYMDNGDGDH